jgi:hypothetical protein
MQPAGDLGVGQAAGEQSQYFPFPLAPGADVIFTFVPSLLGTLLFLLLRRTTSQPVRRFTFVAAAALVLSWIGPLALLLGDVVAPSIMVALLVMHAIPAVVLVAAMYLVDNRPGRPTR